MHYGAQNVGAAHCGWAAGRHGGQMVLVAEMPHLTSLEQGTEKVERAQVSSRFLSLFLFIHGLDPWKGVTPICCHRNTPAHV